MFGCGEMTQEQMILDHMRCEGPITPLMALREYGCFRLAARISDLRKKGHRIDMKLVETRGGHRVAQYRLHYGACK